MTPIIYLDFDGVLNTNRSFKVQKIDKFDPDCIESLNTLVDKTNCNIVISSMWRCNNNLDKLRGYLVESGFLYRDTVIDTTPILSVENPETGFIDVCPCRGLEILAHVRVNKIKKWIAIDDMTDEYMKHHLIQTDYEFGLTKELVELAIEKLKDESLTEKYLL